jgi:hypothetical protein
MGMAAFGSNWFDAVCGSKKMTPEQIEKIQTVIGAPYKLGTDGPEEFDCYGLARYVQRIAIGIDMPAVSRLGDLVRTIKEHDEQKKWERVQSPKEWDLVLMANVIARDKHVGVYIKPSNSFVVIHAEPTMGVCVHDLQSLRAYGMNEIRFFRRRA